MRRFFLAEKLNKRESAYVVGFTTLVIRPWREISRKLTIRGWFSHKFDLVNVSLDSESVS